MPLEKPAYRDNLERLDACFPGKEVLTVKEATEFTGFAYRTVRKMFPFKKFGSVLGISKVVFARELS